MPPKDSKDIQHAIVGLLTSCGNLTIAEIGKRLKMRPHMVRYQVDQLLSERKILLARMLNRRIFGLQVVNVFFDLPREYTKRAADFLARRSEVFWLAHNRGPRSFEATLAVRHCDDVQNLMNDFGERVGTHFREAIVSFETESRYWGARFLTQERRSDPIVQFGYPQSAVEPDATDVKLLTLLRMRSGSSVRDIAQYLGVAQSTAAYRLERLQKWGAVSPDLYFLRVDHDFLQAQLVLNLRARSKHNEKLLLNACSREPHVEGLITGVGCWDFKLVLRVRTTQELLEVEDSILTALGKTVARSSMYIRNRIILGGSLMKCPRSSS